MWVERLGALVILTVSGGWNVNVAAWGSKALGTLPAGMRPAASFYVPAVMDTGVCLVKVGSDGALSVFARNSTIGSGGTICAQACFLAKD